MAAHTHDDVDWASRLPAMRRVDRVERAALAPVARRLTAGLPDKPTVLDVGSGVGGMAATLATELAARGGGTVVLVDAVPELLAEARSTVTATLADAGATAEVRLDTVHADLADPGWAGQVERADLVWASRVVHHLPDQQAAVRLLASVLRAGGLLALAEGSLDSRSLPWDLGVGKPGLESRLIAAQATWFAEMRAGIPDAVPMPYGWPTALRTAGLRDVGSFGYLTDLPASLSDDAMHSVIDRLSLLAGAAEERLDADDQAALRVLLDPAAPEYLGRRDDLYFLGAQSVHYGAAP